LGEKKIGKFGQKMTKVWANLIRFGQNQNLASPKTSDLLYGYMYAGEIA